MTRSLLCRKRVVQFREECQQLDGDERLGSLRGGRKEAQADGGIEESARLLAQVRVQRQQQLGPQGAAPLLPCLVREVRASRTLIRLPYSGLHETNNGRGGGTSGWPSQPNLSVC